jgi:hypothetical protein
VPMLEQSAAEFPKDFNPHARLARIYRLLGRLTDAKTSIERARALVTGPRTLRVLDEQATIAQARGEIESARASYRAIIDYPAWLPPSAARAKQQAKQKLDALAGVADTSAELLAYSTCKRNGPAGTYCSPTEGVQCDPAQQTLAGKHYLRCTGNGTGDLPMVGCRMRRRQALLLSDADGGKLLETRQAVTSALAPKSAADALVLANLFLEAGENKEAPSPTVTGSGPYSVTTYRMQLCGCSHPIARIAATVDKDGTVRETGRTVIKEVNKGLCVD